jgi:uncharacterized membrane protein
VLTLLILYLVSGSFLIAFSLPLLFKKIPPNSFYGFRTPQTMRDPRVWYVVNCYSAKWLIGASVSILIAAVLFYFIPGISVDAYALGCLAVFAVVFIVGLVQSIRFLKKLIGNS